MISKELAILYVNIMARLLFLLRKYPYNCYSIFALVDYSVIYSRLKKNIMQLKKKGAELFVNELASLVKKIGLMNMQQMMIYAFCLLSFLDKMITFENSDNEFLFSLSSLIPIKKDSPVVLVDPLNTNYEETKILIRPKFKVYRLSKIFEGGTLNENKVHNRDALNGFNCLLENVCYYEKDDNCSIIDIVLDLPNQFTGDYLKIGFSPLTNMQVITIDDKTTKKISYGDLEFVQYGMNYSANNKRLVEKRLKQLWSSAIKQNIDVLFFPEALGTDAIEKTITESNLLVKELFEKTIDEGDAPKLICLPSYYNNRENAVTLVYQDGRVLGKQKKNNPFCNYKSNSIEPIDFSEEYEYVIIHIPNYARIVAMICSDYLTLPPKIHEVVFSCIDPTIVLVPSFTRGEQDFINKLEELKKYGTCVIWGNCCGACNNSISGAVSMAYCDEPVRFSDCKKCENQCNNGCLFVISVPIHVTLKNHEKLSANNLVNQILL